jgi:hypothetical protein
MAGKEDNPRLLSPRLTDGFLGGALLLCLVSVGLFMDAAPFSFA